LNFPKINPKKADEKKRKWPNGPPKFTEEREMIRSSKDGKGIIYRYFRTTPIAEEM
jgi:hypothetical protein